MCCAKASEGHQAHAVSAKDLIDVFASEFSCSYNTVLLGGAEEPLYEPSSAQHGARIFFRHDYSASALHEVAHWCIAGAERRRQLDYGYWYEPDGRDAASQAAFVAVESRPQALEWHFARACGLRFRLSLDNLDTPLSIEEQQTFAAAVVKEALRMQEQGLPPRAVRFVNALRIRFPHNTPAEQQVFSLGALL